MRSAGAERGRLLAGALLVVTGGAAWTGVLAVGEDMPMGIGLWLTAWTAMMAAMMLPSAMPLVLLYERGSPSFGRSMLLAGGYLLAWAVVGLVAYQLAVRLPEPGDVAAGAVLVAAGLYQLTPLKSACLRHCRSPMDFLVTHWRPGRLGAVRIGLEHGAYCVGCCWALMAVLVVAGAMALAWVVAIALAVAAEKLLPAGVLLGRIGGAALIGAGAAIAL